MKITKKLAKEIFKGDFSNVDIAGLQKDSKARERVFKTAYDLKTSYINSEFIKQKDFDELQTLFIAHTPKESYSRGKGILMTDIFCLECKQDGYYISIFRDKSECFKGTEFKFSPEKKKQIKNRILYSFGFELI